MRECDFLELLEAENSIPFLGLLYECPTCGRVMWGKPDDDKFTVYERVPKS